MNTNAITTTTTTTTNIFKNRFDVARIQDFDDVSDAIFLMVNRAKDTLLLITDLLLNTERGGSNEIGCLYSAVEELNDIEELTRFYRESIRTKPPLTNSPECAAVVANLRNMADDFERNGLMTERN
ncbi:hypothetical protein [Limnohabitans sp.]